MVFIKIGKPQCVFMNAKISYKNFKDIYLKQNNQERSYFFLSLPPSSMYN